jgi:Tfp pilus assembly PilM family ATPase
MTTTVMFDTLTYVNKLKKAGLNQEIAEVQAQAQAELLRELTENHFATKQDIKCLRDEIKSLENKLENKIVILQDKMENNITVLYNKLLIRMGSVTAIGIGLLATLITVLHG